LARLLIHSDAKTDLLQLAQSEPKLAARLIVLLQEVQSDKQLLDMLTAHEFGTDGRELFHVSHWEEHWNQDKDIWRLKFWELENQGIQYRVIYALKRGTGDHHVLAVTHRDFKYDRNHPTTQRILRAYEEL
jgi:hypothetical protein